MYSYITALALAGGVSARVLPRGQDGCSFQIKASGGQSGLVGQLDDGQVRIGGDHEPATFCIDNGGITDSKGRSCVVTSPNQFQCDQGKEVTPGFSISGSGQITFNGENTFYACGADKNEYNIYTQPVQGQQDCVEVKLSSDGKCLGNNGGGGSGEAGSSSIPAPAASTQPAGEQSTAPAGYESKGPSSSAPAASTSPAGGESTAPAGYESKGPSSSGPAASTKPAAGESTAPAGYESKGPSSGPAASTKPAAGESTAPAGYESKGPSSSAPAASTQPAGEQSTAPAGYESKGPSSASAASTKPAGGKYTPPAGVGSQKPSPPASNSQTQSVPAESFSQSQPVAATTQPKPETSMPAVQSSFGSVQTSHAPQSTGPAGYSSASSEAASTAKPSGTSSGSACQTSLTGAYQTPHLIVPVSSDQPDTAFGTSYNGQINSTTNTIFNFDIPSDYEGKKCSVIFLFPKKEDLETSNYEYSGSGSLSCSELSDTASQETTYSNAPSADKDLGTIDLQPGNSYVVATQDCQVGTQSIELSSKDGLSLNFFQDWNPSPLGLWITAC